MRSESSRHNQFYTLVNWRVWLFPVLLSSLLIAFSYYSFILFHTLIELFTIMVGVTMFIVALYTYPYAKDKFLMYLAMGYFWVAGIDLFHALIYKGIAIFPFGDENYSTQFWLVSRFLESVILFSAPFIFKRSLNTAYAFTTLGLISGAFVMLIMSSHFPATFIEGKGLTAFKVNSEYMICLILALALVNLYIHRNQL